MDHILQRVMNVFTDKEVERKLLRAAIRNGCDGMSALWTHLLLSWIWLQEMRELCLSVGAAIVSKVQSSGVWVEECAMTVAVLEGGRDGGTQESCTLEVASCCELWLLTNVVCMLLGNQVPQCDVAADAAGFVELYFRRGVATSA